MGHCLHSVVGTSKNSPGGHAWQGPVTVLQSLQLDEPCPIISGTNPDGQSSHTATFENLPSGHIVHVESLDDT